MTVGVESLVAWVDASNGVAGDMLLGALVDAGADLEQAQRHVDLVAPATVRLRAEQVTRGGMRATKVHVDLVEPDQHHRHWSEIDARLAGAGLPERVARWSREVFLAVARAESRCHGVPVEDVHFHEVGAWDSIADVVGCCSALDQLGVDELLAGDVALGSGRVRMAHGVLAVPGPAVLELSTGWPTTVGFEGAGELTTPTGMALVRLATHAAHLPPVSVERVGVGAGTKDFDDHPNTVRVVLGRRAGAPRSGAGPYGLTRQTRTLLECNVDDLDPRLWPSVLDALLAAGADDAWLTPILMKKGRPAHTLSALVQEDRLDGVRDVVLTRTSTLGVREATVARHVLDRDWREVAVEGQVVRVKLGLRAGRVVNAQPEWEDVVRAAEALGVGPDVVLARALAAAARAGLLPG